MWDELANKVIYRNKEAKDNVKYLSTLEKVCQPVYSSDPVGVNTNDLVKDKPTIVWLVVLHADARLPLVLHRG